MQIEATNFNPDYSNKLIQENTIPVKSYHSYIFDAVTSIPSTVWQKVKSAFNGKSEFINAKMDEIIQESDFELKKNLFIAALTSNDFHLLRPSLITFFQGLSSDEKDEYLKASVLEGIKLNQNDLVSRCLHLISEQGLKDLIIEKKKLNSDFDFMILVQNHIKLFNINSKYYPYDANMEFIKSEIKTLIPQAFNFVLSIIDMLMMSTELFEANKAPKSAWDAAYQLDVYYKIIAIPATILWTINAYSPNPIVTATAFVLSLTTLIGFVYSYVKWLRPAPKHLPKTINLTEKAEKGEIIPVVGRELEIARLKNQLIRNLNSGDREHPLIIGESGIGKTTLVEGFALEVQKGNIPELKGVQVFMINGATIDKDIYTGKSILSQMRKAMGNYKNKCVLVIDEIHRLLDDESLRTELYSLLDTSSASIPLFIGLTSTDQYQKLLPMFKKESATDRRLNRGVINIEGTDEDHTVAILKSMMHHYYPGIEISEKLCRKIFSLNKEKKELEPIKSKSSLSFLAESVTSGLKGRPLIDATDKKQATLEGKESKEAGPIDFDTLLNNGLGVIDEMNVDLSKDRSKINTYNENVNAYRSLTKQRRDREVVLKNIADKIEKSGIETTGPLLHQFLFEQFYLLPSITTALKVFAEENDLEVTITEKMITDYLKSTCHSMIEDKERKGDKDALDQERKAWLASL